MVQLKARVVRNALIRAGFVEKTKSDHYRYTLWVNGKRARVGTMISLGERDLTPRDVSGMASQLHISTSQFVDLVDGAMSNETYYEILRQKMLLDR